MQSVDHQVSEYDQNYLHLIICFSKSYLEAACGVTCLLQLFNLWTVHACNIAWGISASQYDVSKSSKNKKNTWNNLLNITFNLSLDFYCLY